MKLYNDPKIIKLLKFFWWRLNGVKFLKDLQCSSGSLISLMKKMNSLFPWKFLSIAVKNKINLGSIQKSEVNRREKCTCLNLFSLMLTICKWNYNLGWRHNEFPCFFILFFLKEFTWEFFLVRKIVRFIFFSTNLIHFLLMKCIYSENWLHLVAMNII